MKIMKFYASWCEPCKALSRVFESVKESGVLEMPVEDINIEENTEMSIKYMVRSVPTTIVVSDSGEVLRKKIGMMTESELLEFIEG
jgi:thioredoxin 1